MTTNGSTQEAEQLWIRAHEALHRRDFVAATRDLAACFALLQAAGDPRLPEVHKRWTEVHTYALQLATASSPAEATPTASAP